MKSIRLLELNRYSSKRLKVNSLDFLKRKVTYKLLPSKPVSRRKLGSGYSFSSFICIHNPIDLVMKKIWFSLHFLSLSL